MAAIREPVAEAPTAAWPRRRMTEEEFVRWCDEDTRAEWVDGEVIVASPPTIRHVRINRFLIQLLGLFVAQRQQGEALGPEAQIRLVKQGRRRVPDVLFVSQERQEIIRPSHIEGAPDLVMEIVSPESLARDWREKYLEYEAAGVREYWVIDPMAQQMEVYGLGADGQYAQLPEAGGLIRSGVLADFYLRPEWLWQEPLPNVLDVAKEMGLL